MAFIRCRSVKFYKLLSVLASVSAGFLVAFLYSRPENVPVVSPRDLLDAGNISRKTEPLADMVFTSTRHPMERHDKIIVPNIVHFIKFDSIEISFTEMACILSVFVNHKPEAIWIHCSLCKNGTTMEGKYWDMMMKRNPPVEVRYFPKPAHIFGKEFGSNYHASDVARMQILMEHGGIYLDNDVFVINCLDHFRHYEMSLGWNVNEFIGTQVLLAHKNARFLRLWYNSYHHYNASLWYYNAGELPTTSVLVPKPYLVNRVYKEFGVSMLVHVLYKSIFPEWTDFFTMHLLMRHRSYLDKESPIKEFDENNIKTYDRTFGQMVRLVLFNTTNLL